MGHNKKKKNKNDFSTGAGRRKKIIRKGLAAAAIFAVLGWMNMIGSRAPIVYVDVNLGTDRVGCGAAPGAGACRTVQYALDNETGTGDTVNLAAGTYNENIVIDKRIILAGAGSGSNPTVDTIIVSAAASTNVIRLHSGGISADERLVIRDMRVTGGSGGPNPGNGINIVTGSFITFDNVTAVGNDGNGIAFDPGGNQTDYILSNCNLSNNPGGSGFRVPTTAGVDGLTISDCTMDGNSVIGLSMYGPVTGLDISDSSFDNNGIVGIYGKINDFIIKKGVVIDNVTANGSGRGIALRIYGGSLAISNSTVSSNNRTNPGDIGQGMDLSAREAGCEITLTNVTAEDNEDVNIFLETKYSGSITSASFYNVVVRGSNDEPSAAFCDGCGIWLHTLGSGSIANVSITKSTISGNNRGIVLQAETQPLQNIIINDNHILDNSAGGGILISANAAAGNRAGSNYIVGNGVGVENRDPGDLFDAAGNWWGDAAGPYQAVTNLSGLGDEVSDNVIYDPWLSQTIMTLISPNGGEAWKTGFSRDITWNADGLSGNIKLTLWQNDTVVGTIATNVVPAAGVYSWTVGEHSGGATAPPGTDYKIKIKEIDAANTDISDSPFIIKKFYGVISPNGGENWQIGTLRDITWGTPPFVTGTLKISLWKDGVKVGDIAVNVPAVPGVLSWTVGRHSSGTAAAGTGYTIKIKESGTTVSDTSDAPFSLVVSHDASLARRR
ncbi:MAG: right-handed parallel beta-helix repeat-containing protein [Candidatus Aminicenantes bacterium]|nr:right-handed parallel beta-helix repeat-containing protein [Candidatus Aminicenantes bacterium]